MNVLSRPQVDHAYSNNWKDILKENKILVNSTFNKFKYMD